MNPVRVLYLIRTWALGGSHTIMYLLLEHLPKDRFEIIVVPYDSHSGGDEAFIAGCEKRGIPVAPERIPWKSRFAWNQARQAVSDLVAKYHIDLIHTHDPHSDVLIGIGRKRWPCACVASPYGWWERLFPLRSHVHVMLEKYWALPQFERLITVSENMKSKILEGFADAERIRVVHTGLDLAFLDKGAAREAVRAELAIPAEACVVGTVSRIYIEKGHTYLLQAAAQLATAHPDLHVLIVGDGPPAPRPRSRGRPTRPRGTRPFHRLLP